MLGDSKVVYVKGRPENIYPAGDEWEYSEGGAWEPAYGDVNG
jgi:hypothetical protein